LISGWNGSLIHELVGQLDRHEQEDEDETVWSANGVLSAFAALDVLSDRKLIHQTDVFECPAIQFSVGVRHPRFADQTRDCRAQRPLVVGHALQTFVPSAFFSSFAHGYRPIQTCGRPPMTSCKSQRKPHQKYRRIG
jgi:hypothetical protein